VDVVVFGEVVVGVEGLVVVGLVPPLVVAVVPGATVEDVVEVSRSARASCRLRSSSLAFATSTALRASR
jgi:hypothetical protein